MPIYGLNVENQILILEKANTKKDGVYQFRGVAYRVRSNKITHLACNGDILVPFGFFNAVSGSYNRYASTNVAVGLLKLIKD